MSKKIIMRRKRLNRDILTRIDPNLINKSSISGNGYFFGNANVMMLGKYGKHHNISENNIFHYFWNLRN